MSVYINFSFKPLWLYACCDLDISKPFAGLRAAAFACLSPCTQNKTFLMSMEGNTFHQLANFLSDLFLSSEG